MIPPSRRALLQAASALALAATVPAAAQASRPTWKTAIGLNGFQSSSAKFKKNYPLWEILDFAKETGFDGVELAQMWPASGPYPKPADTDRIRALKRLYDGFGLRIFSIQLMANGAFDPDDAARKAWLDGFTENVKFAKAMGCACVGMWPGGGLRGQTIDQALDRVGASFKEAARIAADAGLTAAFEIEPPFVFNKEAHVHRILELGRPHLKAIYDPSHYDLMNASSGKPHEMLQRVGVGNIGYLHLTDTDGTLRDGGTSKHLPCGDGHANIATSLKVLRDGGFAGWIMIDGWEIPDQYDAAKKGKRMIEEAMK